MENEVKQRNQRNRRRERAQRMQAQRESKVKDGDSGEDESPAREKPPRPPARRKKSREPLGEEDIIDGFAIMAFRTYEDLEAAVKCASSPRTNALSTKPRLPLAALPGDPARNHPPNNVNSHGITLLQDAGTSDDSGRASERLTGSSVAPRDPDSSRDRLSDCDSEGDDDKASPESRNPSPRYHDVSMDDASDAGSLFRVTGAGGGGAAKNELVARGGSGGALALSRAPVGGSASPAPAPLPQPAPSPAPAALPPPALPPPTFRADTPHRANGAHIPAHDGHAATQLPARPIGAAGPDTPERPAGHKLQPGARAAADSPTPAPPAPPAPSPLFPYAAHAAAALPDFRHTNHETRTEPPGAPLDLHAPPAPRPPPPASHPVLPGQDVRPRAAPPAAPPAAPQPPPAAPSLPEPPRPYPAPSIPSSQVNSSVGSGSHHAVPYQPSLQKHSAQPPYAGRPPHLAPFSVASHLAPASSASQPHPASSHSTTSHAPYAHAPAPSYSSALAPGMISSFTAIPPKPALAPADAPISTARVPNGFTAPLFAPAYPPLYAPYSATLHSPYLPPAAASPRNVSDTRTSLSSSPLVAPKTPKGVRPHTPGSTGAAGAPLAPLSYSPSPARERENFSNISSMSRSTPVSAASAPVSAPPPLVPPLSAPLAAPIAAPLTAPLSAPLPGPLPAPLAAPLSTSLSGPLPTPLSAPLAPPPLSAGLSSLGAPLPAIGAPLATPTPTAPAASHPLAHSLAPVPTVPSISSGSKPPAHWGSTRPPGPERTSFAPAPPLFGAPLPPPNPNPFSAESLFQTSPGADLLRRELDNRFLAAAGAVGANVGATSVRTEMHHHQHQHTHVHQHPPPHHHQLLVPHPPLFKDVAKMPSLYRTGLGLGYPYSSGLLHPTAPYVPPAPITSYAPKKTGKWNAMHVRIAWEIYNHQQKEKSSGAGALPPPADKDKLRAFPAAPAPPPPYRSPYELAPYLHHAPLGTERYLPAPPPPLVAPTHRGLRLSGVSPFARYGAAYPPAPPAFPLSAYGLPALHAHALHDAWRARPPLAAERRDLDERARRERDERERRERDERRKRELERGRARSPLRAPDKDERKEPPRAPPLAYAPPPWDPYRFDPLQHMRFAPLVEAAIRAEEDRAKMLSAYAHQQLKAPLLHRAPVDLLKKEEPR